MKVSVIGTGYVGLVSGTCFAEIGHDVTCIDLSEDIIQTLKKGESPIYEPGLTDLLKRNIKSKRLHFSTDYESVKEAEFVFIAIQTPSGKDGAANLSYLIKGAEMVAEKMKEGAVVIIKSTVPVGTSNKVKEAIDKVTNKNYHLVSNPEFLKEGSAVEDFMRPDRVIIGTSDQEAAKLMEELYAPLVRQGNPIYNMSNLSAEMSKYAANCFLATKISFINEIAKLCDLTGADIEQVRKGIGSDRRIGSHFLYPGPGYGGSCFPKDVKALVETAREHDLKLQVVDATEEVNKKQKIYMAQKIEKHFSGDLKGKVFSFWGLAFKANTDDVRETSAIDMANYLIERGASLKCYDPEATSNFKEFYQQNFKENSKSISYFDNMYETLNGSNGLVTITEWREFKAPEFNKVYDQLQDKVIFDSRNLYSTQKVLDAGFKYYAIGKNI